MARESSVILKELEEVISGVENSRGLVEDLQKQLQKASTKYQAEVSKAQDLKVELDESLNEKLGEIAPKTGRVSRIS